MKNSTLILTLTLKLVVDYEKKVRRSNGFINSTNNINLFSIIFEEKFTKIKDKNNQLENFIEVLKATNSPFFIGSANTLITFSMNGFGLLVVPITASVNCGVTLGTELTSEISEEKVNFLLSKEKVNFF